jgi:hypothetical protein
MDQHWDTIKTSRQYDWNRSRSALRKNHVWHEKKQMPKSLQDTERKLEKIEVIEKRKITPHLSIQNAPHRYALRFHSSLLEDPSSSEEQEFDSLRVPLPKHPRHGDQWIGMSSRNTS